jgi:hypothetical protein
LLHPWYISPADNGIPSTSKWDGGALPSAAERCPTGAAGQPGLALAAALGSAWTASRPKGGLRPLFCGDGFRRAPCPTWAVSQLLSTSSWVPGAAVAEHGEVRAAGGEAGNSGRTIQDGG